MKKRKILLMVVSILLVATLCGCSVNIPFLNKGDGNENTESTPPDEGPSAADRAVPISGLSFLTGDTVTVDDLVTIDELEAGNVIQKMIMQDDGTLGESYTFAEAGEYTITVLIEFIDSVVYNGQCTVEVTEKTTELPDTLSNNIATRQWATYPLVEITDVQDGEIVNGSVAIKLSYVDDAIGPRDFPLSNFSISVTPDDTGKILLYTTFVTPEVINKLNALGLSPLHGDTSMALTMGMMKALIGMAGEESGEDESLTEMINLFDWYSQWYSSITTTSTVNTGLMLYDTDGNQYPIMLVEYTVDLTSVGGTTGSFAGPAYIDYDGKRILLSASEVTVNVSVPTEGEEEGGQSTEEPKIPASYEEFVAHIQSYVDESTVASITEGRQTVDQAKSYYADVANLVIIGDVTPLLPVPEEGSQTVEDPGEQGGEEPGEPEGVVADIRIPYSQQHPEIYTWPEEETKYRRWVYLIDNATQFVSTIVNPDGTYVISGMSDMDENWGMQAGGQGGSGAITGPVQPGPNSDTYDISSSYSSYTVSNSGYDKLTIDKDNSTSGRVAVKVNNRMYYIETARSSQIQNYVNNCVYPTADFRDGDYQVVEHADQTYQTDIGKITPYTVRWVDSTGNQRENPYMAVYNIQNDYLVVYGDRSGLVSEDILVEILRASVYLKR